MYFPDLFFLGTVNVRHKNWGKRSTSWKHIFQGKDTLTLREFSLDQTFWFDLILSKYRECNNKVLLCYWFILLPCVYSYNLCIHVYVCKFFKFSLLLERKRQSCFFISIYWWTLGAACNVWGLSGPGSARSEWVWYCDPAELIQCRED